MDVDLVGYAIELIRQVLDRRLHEHCVWQTALRRFPRRLHRRLFERFYVRVHADVELVRVRFRRSGHKTTVARPDVDHYSFAGTGQ